MFAIIEARFYEDLSDMAQQGARAVLDDAGIAYEVLTVPGALEIPAALSFAVKSGKYEAFILLGTVIRGETTHYEVVCDNSMRGIYDLVLKHNLAVGNGIQTCETRAQVVARFDPQQKDKAGGAAQAAITMLEMKNRLGKKG